MGCGEPGGWAALARCCSCWFPRVLCCGLSSLLGGPGGDLLSRVLGRSTIGAEGFHGRVRDGIGWGTLAMATRPSQQGSEDGSQEPGSQVFPGSRRLVPGAWCVSSDGDRGEFSSSIERLGPVSCTHCCASTSGLSTCWSCTALMARPGFEGSFPLRCFQRLSRPDIATRLCRWRDNRSTGGPSTPVLSY